MSSTSGSTFHYLLVAPYIPAPTPSNLAVTHPSARGMVPLRRGTSRFLLLITCYPQEPHTGPPSPSHSTEVSVVYIGLDPSLDNYLLVEPYIPAPPPSTRAVIHLSTRGMVPLRHGTSRFLLLITRYTPSLRLVPRRHFASTTRAFLVYLFSRTRRRR